LKKWGSEHAFDTDELLLLSFSVKLSSTSSKLELFVDTYGFRILLLFFGENDRVGVFGQ
jgi:hypothetical protein